MQLTDNGGFVHFESWDGCTLYYVKSNNSPLFAKPLTGGPEVQILDSVSMRAFFVVDDGIHHITRADKEGAYPLQLFDFTTRDIRVLTRIDAVTRLGLTVSPDRKTFLFSVRNRPNNDLMLIENFR